MGKNLKGRQIGKRLSQRKDGRFSARFTKKSGQRVEKYFTTLPEARNWLADAKYEDAHAAKSDGLLLPAEMSEMTLSFGTAKSFVTELPKP